MKNDQFIILKHVGQWVLHEVPSTYETLDSAKLEASNLNCRTLIVRIKDIVIETSQNENKP
jgi:hypothetical protein